MRHVRLQLHVPHRPASDVYTTLADFERYPSLSDAVQSVAVTEVSETVTVSTWEVTFRAGLLRWTQEDTLDPGALTITFRQLDGERIMNLLRAERDTLNAYIPGLDKYLGEIPLLELEQPGRGALQKFRELGGPGLLVPAE